MKKNALYLYPDYCPNSIFRDRKTNGIKKVRRIHQLQLTG